MKREQGISAVTLDHQMVHWHERDFVFQVNFVNNIIGSLRGNCARISCWTETAVLFSHEQKKEVDICTNCGNTTEATALLQFIQKNKKQIHNNATTLPSITEASTFTAMWNVLRSIPWHARRRCTMPHTRINFFQHPPMTPFHSSFFFFFFFKK